MTEHSGISPCECGRVDEGISLFVKAKVLYEQWGAKIKMAQTATWYE
jgi:hypothetical protein